MPVTIGNNAFNIGQDAYIAILDDEGNQIPLYGLGHVINFTATQDDVELKVIPIELGGLPLFATLPQGWTGKVSLVRYSNALDNVLAQIESDFYNNGVLHYFTIKLAITNRDGSVDQYTFHNVALSKGDFGNFQADKEVDQSFAFRAQTFTNDSGVLPIIASGNAIG